MSKPRSSGRISRARTREGARKPGRQAAKPITPEVFDAILTRYANGETLVAACKAERIPRSSLYAVLAKDAALRARHEELVPVSVEAMLDDAIAQIETDDKTERARLRFHAVSWRAARLLAHRYGDRQRVEHEGSMTFHSVPAVAAELRKLTPPSTWRELGIEEGSNG